MLYSVVSALLSCFITLWLVQHMLKSLGILPMRKLRFFRHGSRQCIGNATWLCDGEPKEICQREDTTATVIQRNNPDLVVEESFVVQLCPQHMQQAETLHKERLAANPQNWRRGIFPMLSMYERAYVA